MKETSILFAHDYIGSSAVSPLVEVRSSQVLYAPENGQTTASSLASS